MKRILFAIPIPYYRNAGFWVRESGLIVLALNEMGYDSKLITLTNTGQGVEENEPMLTATLEELNSPEWWKQQGADAIVLNLWSAPRHDGIRKAALAATPRVIERLDTSGVRIPRIWPMHFFILTWGLRIDRGENRFLAFFPALLKHLLFLWFPSMMEKPMAQTMARLPYVVAESPLAAARIARHLRWHGKAGKVAQISNPVLTTSMFYNGETPKENRIVSVARWEAFQKDFPLLLAVATDFLALYPEWYFDLVGSGSEKFQDLIDRIPAEVRKRMVIHGSMPQADTVRINQKAKIHFIASRWEGFCNASIEALCCGCSYVGPIDLAGSSYLIENRSGTLACGRGRAHLLDALCAEAESWLSGRRDPEAIAKSWKAEAGYREVAERTLRLLESVEKG